MLTSIRKENGNLTEFIAVFNLIGHNEIVLGLEDEQYSLAEYVHQPVGGNCGVVLQ